MAKNTSILLGDHFEKFISSRVKSGRYGSASEVVRTALRLLESEEQKLKDLRKAIVTGLESKMVENFDPKTHLKSLQKRIK